MQSETHTQNAGKSLVDLTISPISMEETGHALFESTSTKSTTGKEGKEITVSNKLDEEMWKTPMHEGSDSENKLNIPIFYTIL